MSTDTSKALKHVDRIEIISLVDNYVDLLLGNTDIVTRPPLSKGDELPTDTLIAEHGLSMLVTVYKDKTSHTILFDTGYNSFSLLHNLAQLDRSLDEIEGVVLSHGHMDHTGSIYEIFDKMRHPVSLIVHPQAFHARRYVQQGDRGKLAFPQTLARSRIEQSGANIIESRSATSIADGMVLVTGEVERVTSFEKGFPNAVMEKGGRLDPDPISDDQSLVIHLEGKGLVVVSGCAHSGIINTVSYCRKLTGVENIHAILGGFHLTGPVFEPIIGKTISELKKIAPQTIVPMHCTGWKAINLLWEQFPESFILNSVGSQYSLS
jgi:7,8-dihydropterin-6-yl-methyl-4-(beta-D-ribofuranosyl)aminobenzene 5'-phosphate synthase